MKNNREAYINAGVDVEAGYEAVKLISHSVAKTRIQGVLSNLGGFSGAFEIPAGFKEPVLISGTDGVGTKLKIAFLLDKHDTVGIDCVAMCVNDVLCCGARPLFFLDYVAVGKNLPERVASIVSGVAEGCVQAECALIGGETAEMPGFYPVDEYDLAGFAVGIVEKSKILDNKNVNAGDVLIALPSSGVHSNGFSLVRKILKLDKSFVSPIGGDVSVADREGSLPENGGKSIDDREGSGLNKYIAEFGKTLGEELLTPTKIYVKPVLNLLNKNIKIKSMAHITGGGFYENIPRSIPDDLSVRIIREKLKILPVFEFLMREGNLDENQMFHIFNMGVGMTLTISPDDVDSALKILNNDKNFNANAYVIGEVIKKDGASSQVNIV